MYKIPFTRNSGQMSVLNDIRTLHENMDSDFLHIMRLVRHVTQVCTKFDQEKPLH